MFVPSVPRANRVELTPTLSGNNQLVLHDVRFDVLIFVLSSFCSAKLPSYKQISLPRRTNKPRRNKGGYDLGRSNPTPGL